jgi:hypothetical protein
MQIPDRTTGNNHMKGTEFRDPTPIEYPSSILPFACLNYSRETIVNRLSRYLYLS